MQNIRSSKTILSQIHGTSKKRNYRFCGEDRLNDSESILAFRSNRKNHERTNPPQSEKEIKLWKFFRKIGHSEPNFIGEKEG